MSVHWGAQWKGYTLSEAQLGRKWRLQALVDMSYRRHRLHGGTGLASREEEQQKHANLTWHNIGVMQ